MSNHMTVELEVNVRDVAEAVINTMRPPEIVKFIIALDVEAGDWEVTDALVKHFDSLKELRAKEMAPARQE